MKILQDSVKVKIFVLINSVDRAHCSPRLLRRIEDFFSKQESVFKIVPFTSREQSLQAINEAGEGGYDTLVMGGGDGTIHNLFNLAFDKGFTFGIIPLGTVNALAHSLGIPSDPIKACRIILGGHVRHVDVCLAAGRLFTCFASVGFDASVVHTINPKAKVLMERIAFGYQGVKRLFYLDEIAPFEVEIPQQGKKLVAYSIIISNIPNYAGFQFFSEEPDDGKMEILVFRKNTIPDYLLSVGKMLVSKKAGKKNDESLFRTKITELFIRSPRHLFLQLDGEPVSLSPGQEIKFEIMPRASRFLAPESE